MKSLVIRLVALLLFPVALSFATEDDVIGIYTVRFTDPEAAAQLLEALISPAAGTQRLAVQTAGQRLIVRASPAQHAEIESVLLDVDRPPKNVRVEVQFDRREDRSAREAGVRPQGPVTITRTGIHARLSGQLQDRSDHMSERTVQHLTVIDGGRAQLRVGESVPWLSWLEEYSFRHGYLRTARIEWLETGSFLSVEPEILGSGLIRIRVVPVLSGRDGDGIRQSIRFTEIATEVVARDGHSVSLGGFAQDQEFYSRFLVGRSGGQDSQLTDITLTPSILTP